MKQWQVTLMCVCAYVCERVCVCVEVCVFKIARERKMCVKKFV